MPAANTDNDLYEVILIYSGVGYAALAPASPAPSPRAPTSRTRWR